jgi:hypothetical protein
MQSDGLKGRKPKHRKGKRSDRNNWFQQKIECNTQDYKKRALQYRPSGKKDIGRPKKRWRDAV